MADKDLEVVLAKIRGEISRIQESLAPQEVEESVRADLSALYAELKEKKPDLTLEAIEREYLPVLRAARIESLKQAMKNLRKLEDEVASANLQ